MSLKLKFVKPGCAPDASIAALCREYGALASRRRLPRSTRSNASCGILLLPLRLEREKVVSGDTEGVTQSLQR
jgi:hypothetical protein